MVDKGVGVVAYEELTAGAVHEAEGTFAQHCGGAVGRADSIHRFFGLEPDEVSIKVSGVSLVSG